MQGTANGPLFSASDLVAHMHCEHLTNLETRSAVEGSLSRSKRNDPLLHTLSQKGFDHEDKLLEQFSQQQREVVDLSPDRDDPDHILVASAQTEAAMKSGVDVIYQATFSDRVSVGHADYLVRTDGKSALGSYHYEVWDTKLARRVKPDAILQLSDYSNHVARVQGRRPQFMTVVTGDLAAHVYRNNDFLAFYRQVRADLIRTIKNPRPTYPERNDHCSVCSWIDLCTPTWRYSDDLKAVWGLTKNQRRNLILAEVPSVTRLASLDPSTTVPHVSAETLSRLQRQAALQVQQRRTGRASYQLLDKAAEPTGLGALPVPDGGDVYFDFEGDPLEGAEGLEYLFGLFYRANGIDHYKPVWAHSAAEEKEAFTWFVSFVQERLQTHPDMHVYHYGAYEQSALLRLSQRHKTQWVELEQLFNQGVFVDMYSVVRGSMQTSGESLGLKAMEAFYLGSRTGEVADAASSIVVYEQWLRNNDPKLLADIADYNEADCRSLLGLQTFLESVRQELVDSGTEVARGPLLFEHSEVRKAADDETALLYDRLLAGLSPSPEQWTESENAQWLAAQLLSWHQREAKAEWQDFFRRVEMSEEERAEDGHCLSKIVLDAEIEPEPIARSLIFTYHFDQHEEHSLRVGDVVIDPATSKSAGTIIELDQDLGIIRLKRGRSSDDHPRALIPSGPVDTGVLKKSLMRFGALVAEQGLERNGHHQALKDLLARRAPHFTVDKPGPLVARYHSPQREVLRALPNLDETCLVVQGPPGSGKTYLGANAILQAIKRGEKVGICAFSHAAVKNLVNSVVRLGEETNAPVRILYKGSPGDFAEDCVTVTTKNEDVEKSLGSFDVVAGTPWLFAREKLDSVFDLLVIDEAGQMSLANAVAIGSSAKNLLLLGDPQQLQQPAKGRHPDGAEVSAMRHFMGSEATIAPTHGILLNVTRRLNRSTTRLTSEMAYDGRLRAHKKAAAQHLDGEAKLLGGKGMRFVSVPHEGNKVASAEEASVVAKLYERLVGQPWTNIDGQTRTIAAQDIVIMAPYNAHVLRLKAVLPDDARVGTVDRFQGQEAVVSIYSLATSSLDDVPRSVDFILNRNRMNVATSRARVLSFVVAAPALLSGQPKSIEQMRMFNALCLVAQSRPAFDQDLNPTKVIVPRRDLAPAPTLPALALRTPSVELGFG